MANTLKEFWSKVSKYVAFGNLEEVPLSQEQLETFDINNRTDEKQSENNLNDIDNLLNQLEHKENGSLDKKFNESPEFGEYESKDDEKNLS